MIPSLPLLVERFLLLEKRFRNIFEELTEEPATPGR